MADDQAPAGAGAVGERIASGSGPALGGGPASVDHYLAGLPTVRRAQIEELRRAIRAAAPGAEECIAYNMPALRLHGRFLLSYEAFKGHTSLFPASQLVKDALGPDLAPYLTGKATIRFPAAQPIPLNLVTSVAQVRMGEVAASAAAASSADITARRPRRASRS